MASREKNLSVVLVPELENPSKLHIAVVRAIWNKAITDKLLEGARNTLIEAGIPEDQIHVCDVPGSFELTMGAKIQISNQKVDAVICLGCVIKGETDHDKYINQAVANGLTQLGLVSGIPCIFGLLTVNSMLQAEERAGGKHGNKGVEAAATALTMINLKKSATDKKQIGFQ